jgi:hypothetical protein
VAQPDERMEGTRILRQDVTLRLIGDKSDLLRTAKHVINERTIQIFATRTNEIKKGFVIFHIIFLVN